MPINDFSYTILEYINNAVRSTSVKPFNLGGVTASGGGSGTPPGGYVGYLPQTRVAYDLSELADDGIPVSGMSILDNLNHIRYRVETLENAPVIRTYTWVIGNPATGGVPGPRMAEDHTIVRLDTFVTAETSVTFNIEERPTVGISGTDIMASGITATTSGVYTTSFSNNDLNSGSWLWVDISDVTGVPEKLVITVICGV